MSNIELDFILFNEACNILKREGRIIYETMMETKFFI